MLGLLPKGYTAAWTVKLKQPAQPRNTFSAKDCLDRINGARSALKKVADRENQNFYAKSICVFDGNPCGRPKSGCRV